MALAINNNLMSNNVTRNLQTHYGNLNRSTQRLSSGLRVSSASDDAAGLAIRELMRADIAALGQGVRNANDGISMIQTADGALGVIDSKLIRMKELAEQASSDTYTNAQRTLINQEYQSMADEITRIAEDTDFNGKKLLNGDGGKYEKEVGDFAAAPANTVVKLKDADGVTTLTATAGTETITAVNRNKEGIAVQTKFTATAKDQTVVYTQADIDGTANDGDPTDATTLTGSKIIFDRSKTTATEVTENIEVEAASNLGKLYAKAATENRLQMEQSTDGGKTWTTVADTTAGTTAGASVRITVFGEGTKRVDTFMVDKKSDGSASAGVFSLDAGEFTTDTANDTKITISSENFTSTNVHFGSSSASTDSYQVNVGRSTASALGVGDEVSDHLLTKSSAKLALDNIDKAIKLKDASRAELGSTQNRLNATIENITIQKENLQAAESRISDVDVATEMTEFNKQQILANAAVSMLSQANNLPKMAQKLLG